MTEYLNLCISILWQLRLSSNSTKAFIPLLSSFQLAMAEEMSIQAMALQKRNADKVLMPPPPPKRIKRPPKTLSEEDYTAAITTIIERDFYPNLPEMRKQTRYLDALQE